ncbi:PAS domain S-box-containing protein [Desulfonauticus submarinus]|uniref:histidine kinase n=1 Tax=Desulfonauticus submarinus TaxID=206665 RepID=A0A1H0B4M7_9BACT|nr:CHASE4 domain-containing protein [Desulfonauticus submarinus]SDN40562.1 PAS domain S-box-containing protein [Desulfonauticus submarinus]
MLSIRRKIIIFWIITSILLFVGTLLLIQGTFFSTFQSLEKNQAIKQINVAKEWLEGIKEHLKGYAIDWAAWDETYDFIYNLSPDYVSRNLMPDSFTALQTNAIMYYNAKGKLLYYKAIDIYQKTEISLPIDFLEFLSKFIKTQKVDFPHTKAWGDYFYSSQGLIIFTGSPIVTSDFQGPIRGTVVLARIITPQDLSVFFKKYHFLLKILPAKNKNFKQVEFISDLKMKVATLLSAQGEKQYILLQTILPRNLHLQFKKLQLFFTGSMVVLTIVIFLGFAFFLQKNILQDLHLLVKSLPTLVSPSKFEKITLQPKSRETFTLISSINTLLDKIKNLLEEENKKKKTLNTILENLPLGIVLIRKKDNQILWTNSNFLKMTNYSLKELQSKKCSHYICQPTTEIDLQDFDKDLDLLEVELLSKQGQKIFCLKKAIEIDYEGESCILEILIDITKYKELEHELRQAEKLKTTGLLAGTVAHELNNLFSSLVLYPEILQRKLPRNSDLNKPLTTIKDSALRAATLVEDLLTLARRNLPTQETLNLSEVIKECQNSPEIQKILTHYPKIKLKWPHSDLKAPIKGNKTLLMKAIFNTIKNSVEAIDSQGEVKITLKVIRLKETLQGYETIPAGEYVYLSIEDTGKGISPQVLSHIFEPFFSQKPLGQSGTGLGTTVIWNVIKDMKGYIDVKSKLGKGTIFSFYLPLSKEKIPTIPKNSNVNLQYLPAYNLKVLVVDDKKEQRDLAKTVLEEFSCKVETATNGQETFDKLQNKSFDLIMLDVLLENENGIDIAEKILKIDSEQKIILVTGYAETEKIEQALKLGVLTYIKKPYTLEKIYQTLKKYFS